MLPKRPYARAARVAPVLQQSLARILQPGYVGSDLGLLTVNHVDLSRDLSSAKVFVSFLLLNQADHSAQDIQCRMKACIAGLNKQVPKIRHMLSSEIKLKYMPDLLFVFDEIPMVAEKINKKINELLQTQVNTAEQL